MTWLRSMHTGYASDQGVPNDTHERRRSATSGGFGREGPGMIGQPVPAVPGGSCMSAPVEFAVWAPLPERVRLQVDGAVHDMTREDGGWWRAEVEASPEADYGFLL